MILSILFSAFITIFSYMLVPGIISVFSKKPISRNIRILIVVVNGIIIFMIFQLFYNLIHYIRVPNAAPAFIWSTVNYYILKRKSDHLINKSHTPIEDIPKGNLNVLLQFSHKRRALA
jgi:hypothetical protein